MAQPQSRLQPPADALITSPVPITAASCARSGPTPSAGVAATSGDAPNARSRGERVLAPGQLAVCSQRHGADHVVAVAGELDLATVQDVEEALQAAEAGDADQVILDLSGLTFIDSTGVRLIILADARSRANGGRLRLRRGPRQVQRVFEISGIAGTLPFAD